MNSNEIKRHETFDFHGGPRDGKRYAVSRPGMDLYFKVFDGPPVFAPHDTPPAPYKQALYVFDRDTRTYQFKEVR